jgi:hypothetical protein
MPRTKLIALAIGLIVVVGALLWFLVVPSYFQNSHISSQNAAYTSLTLRTGINNTATIKFGDTDYSFSYYYYYPHPEGSYLTVSTFVDSNTHYGVKIGDTYTDFGVEAKVSDVGWDDVSNYIVILVKPVIQNYASIHYTRLNLTLGQAKSVNINSSSGNETRQYIFSYTQSAYGTSVVSQITIRTNSQEETYSVFENCPFVGEELNVAVRIYKIESSYMVIYVKPLY